MKIQGVILDWAGTTIDYGCFAPLAAFIKAYENKGIAVTAEEARKPMGMLKRDHMQAIGEMDNVARQWQEKYGRPINDADLDEMYADFEQLLFSVLRDYAKPIPGAVELVSRLRQQGIKVGSTTGYTMEMMMIVAEEAKKNGYSPDCLVTPDEVPAGRPYPWMCYENAIRLDLYPMKHVVKAGDTISDVREGINAGAWSVGILKGSNELGMTEAEVQAGDSAELAAKLEEIKQRYLDAGAHYVIETIGDLDQVIEQINDRLAKGDRP
ncbi:phosphonoacetaldehyde hydrolase [Paenibacillus sp. NPDC056579]|uniref:phosphonoacetaldehyde hydrolase n=1 Tax=unclassified Paenibacillus TaxID=185978 RepID=UPI001EF86D7C|nr:phosphonoacetaldehyde hydrolase [Paenibacillus sp. H1-7]ULL14052.1 phosphonoacetaldehyde hydrolase [Paenibacillus sp. H1-7]